MGRDFKKIEERLQGKMERIQAGAQGWIREGRDPSPIKELMDTFEPLVKKGKLMEAEKALDRALEALEVQ